MIAAVLEPPRMVDERPRARDAAMRWRSTAARTSGDSRVGVSGSGGSVGGVGELNRLPMVIVRAGCSVGVRVLMFRRVESIVDYDYDYAAGWVWPASPAAADFCR